MTRDVTTAVTLALTVILVALMLTVHETNSFEYMGYCQKMCRWGRGGNLCRCNAVHFAGKRNSVTPPPDVLDLPDDVTDDVESSRAADQLRKWFTRAALAVQSSKDGQAQTNSASDDLSRAKQ